MTPFISERIKEVADSFLWAKIELLNNVTDWPVDDNDPSVSYLKLNEVFVGLLLY